MKTKIIYKTKDINQNIIKSSAVLYMPKNPIGVYFIHHGTIFTNDMAPTNNTIIYNAIAKLFVDSGYMVVFPDYIGFGISYETHFHPYLHKESLAKNSLDLLEHLLEKNIIDANLKIYSTGYSEGGYASLAFVELAQKNRIIIDSINGAAPYNLVESLSYLIKDSMYEYPEYIAYTAYSYEKIYCLDGLVENMFKSIYAKVTLKAFKERYSFERIHKIYPKELSRLINFDFLYGESELMTVFKSKLKENSLISFVPQGKTLFFSARYDEIVDVNHSLKMYSHIKRDSAVKIDLIIDEDGDSSHFGSYGKFLSLIKKTL